MGNSSKIYSHPPSIREWVHKSYSCVGDLNGCFCDVDGSLEFVVILWQGNVPPRVEGVELC